MFGIGDRKLEVIAELEVIERQRLERVEQIAREARAAEYERSGVFAKRCNLPGDYFDNEQSDNSCSYLKPNQTSVEEQAKMTASELMRQDALDPEIAAQWLLLDPAYIVEMYGWTYAEIDRMRLAKAA